LSEGLASLLKDIVREQEAPTIKETLTATYAPSQIGLDNSAKRSPNLLHKVEGAKKKILEELNILRDADETIVGVSNHTL